MRRGELKRQKSVAHPFMYHPYIKTPTLTSLSENLILVFKTHDLLDTLCKNME